MIYHLLPKPDLSKASMTPLQAKLFGGKMDTMEELKRHFAKVCATHILHNLEVNHDFIRTYLKQKEFIMAGKGNARSGSSQAKDMGSQGGKSGGPARARKLTTQQRSEIARKGAVAKNAKHKKK